jgi:hypothetical protein
MNENRPNRIEKWCFSFSFVSVAIAIALQYSNIKTDYKELLVPYLGALGVGVSILTTAHILVDDIVEKSDDQNLENFQFDSEHDMFSNEIPNNYYQKIHQIVRNLKLNQSLYILCFEPSKDNQTRLLLFLLFRSSTGTYMFFKIEKNQVVTQLDTEDMDDEYIATTLYNDPFPYINAVSEPIAGCEKVSETKKRIYKSNLDKMLQSDKNFA